MYEIEHKRQRRFLILLTLVYFFLWLFLKCKLYIYTVAKDIDLQHSLANKQFIERLQEGSYEIVHPFQIRENSRERLGIDTRQHFLNATPSQHFRQVSFVIKSNVLSHQRLRMVLALTENLLSLKSRIRQKNESEILDDDNVRRENRIENCYYQGSIHNEPDSMVALSTCNGLWGVIAFNNETTFGIWPLEGGDRSKRHPHVLYRINMVQSKCGTMIESVMHHQHRKKRLPERKNKKQRQKLQLEKLFLELALIGDFTMIQQFNMSQPKTLEYLLNMLNLVDLLFLRSFNLQLSLDFVEFWSDTQLLRPDIDAQQMLNELLDYKTKQSYERTKEATIFLTGHHFSNDDTMAAIPGSVCTSRAVAIIQVLDQFLPHTTAFSLIHSLGHILGLDHDIDKECSSGCSEVGGHCLMSPHFDPPILLNNLHFSSLNPVSFPLHFSTCSIGRLHSLLSSSYHLQQCLFTRPHDSSTARIILCGNGILNMGEECDCGNREHCQDQCCDPLSCQLRSHAKCADHQPCCHRCQFKPAGHLCRQARSVCDVPEVCDGRNGDCPSDGYLLDGTQCGIGGNGQCWQGECADAEAQCKKLWGQGAKLADQLCFEQNRRSVEYGNCGHDLDGNFMECAPNNERCGLLQCREGMDSPVLPNVNSFALQFAYGQKFVQCKVVTNSIFSIVHDGTSCAQGHVCLNSVCLPLIQVSPPIQCPSNALALQCSGHGDCTSTRQCLCFDGWTGQACDKHAINDNSWPANIHGKLVSGGLLAKSYHNLTIIPRLGVDGRILETTTLVTILLLVGLLLLMLLICLLLCYRRRNSTDPYHRVRGIHMKGKTSPNKLNKEHAMEGEEENMERIQGKAIKFGQMPSWREEKRKRKTNKRVYDALQRITEANEADSLSIKSRESSMTINNCTNGPRIIQQNLMTTDELVENVDAMADIGSPKFSRTENCRLETPSTFAGAMLFEPPFNNLDITNKTGDIVDKLLLSSRPYTGIMQNDIELSVAPFGPRLSNISLLMHKLDGEIGHTECVKNFGLMKATVSNDAINQDAAMQPPPPASADSGNDESILDVRESPSLFSDPYRLNLPY